jgi:hypothetical protein
MSWCTALHAGPLLIQPIPAGGESLSLAQSLAKAGAASIRERHAELLLRPA